jgi:peptidyl-prolyl cis-trans isomerase A (cyclophilin A)
MRQRTLTIILLLLCLVIPMACTKKTEEKPAEKPTPATEAPAAPITQAPPVTQAPPTTEPPKAVDLLLSPHSPEMMETAPETYNAKFDTSKGSFTVKVTRSLAPLGADRFYNLVKHGFYDECRFFRVLPNFVVQFGISGNPDYSKFWREARIDDDPIKGSNKKWTITFATAGPNTRTTQVFINYADNTRLDGQGFAQFGEVTAGTKVLESLNSEYGGRASDQQGKIQTEGNSFLKSYFPNLDYIKKASIVK